MVKQEYKKTEIGMLPVEWAVDNLGSRADIYRGGSPRPIQAYLTQSANGLNWIKIGDVKPGEKYITSTQEKIIPEGLSKTRQVSVGDFILSNSMSFGRPYILCLDGCIHDGWLTIQNYKESFGSDYLYYVLSSDAVIKQYISMASGSSVQNLNKEKVAAVLLAVPSKSEQKAISEVLSDIDTLIANLEKLIAKKKAITQGAMQELLTGKRRLPGFGSEWKLLYFRETGIQILKGQTITQKNVNVGNIPVVAGGKTPAYYCDKANRFGRNITISASGASAGFVNFYSGDIFASDCSTIGESEKYSVEYIYYILLNMQTAIYAAQTGGAQPHIHPKDIYELTLLYTFDVKEQSAIARVLSDMDNEIIALEQKLDKANQIKKGMMSELLTGRIRLV